MKAFWKQAGIVAVALALGLASWVGAERADIYVERGTGYVLLFTQGEYVVGFGRANPAVRGAFGATGHVIPDGAFFFRTDLGTIYTSTAGSWAALSLAGQTLSSPAISGTVSGGATFTAPTLTTPTLTSPVVTGSASSGILVAKRCSLTENATNTTYTCTVTVPAGAVVEDVQVIARALWDGTSASLDVGDTADPNGFFAAVNLKATDLLVGEMLSVKHGDLWGGKNGVYLVAATGRRGAIADNFAMSYVAGSNITFVVTEGAADGTAGRTDCVVTYSTPEAVTPVLGP